MGSRAKCLERATRIELAFSAWEAVASIFSLYVKYQFKRKIQLGSNPLLGALWALVARLTYSPCPHKKDWRDLTDFVA